METNEKIKGKDIWLYYNSGTTETPTWEKFACSTSDGFSISTESISTATKCDEGFTDSEPSDKSWEFSSTALALKDATLAENTANQTTAVQLIKDGTKGQFKMTNADETYYRGGTGYISSYNETADRGDFLIFDLTITGSGVPVLEAPAPAV